MIRKNEKERVDIEQKAVRRLEKAKEIDRKFRNLEETEIIGQETLAKKMIETEMLSEAKSDELAFKEIELHK